MRPRTKEQWQRERHRWLHALREIAKDLGERAEITRLLGGIAWGRHEGKQQVGESRDHVAFGAGYLQGVRDTALMAADVFVVVGAEELRRIHARMDVHDRKS